MSNKIISKETQENYNTLIEETEDFIQGIIQNKYLNEDEECFEDIINNRFKNELTKIDKDSNRVNKSLNLIKQKKFIPAGSILAGLGLTQKRKITLSNCYYVPIEHDSLDGIYEARKRMAKVYSRRGGCGTSFTILRPRNSKVHNASEHSTGAVSFMPGFSQDVYDIGQKGRRGAALGDLDCRHPDLLDFIWCKAKPDKIFTVDQFTGDHPNVNYLNISVQITDKFMEAVENDEDWELFFPDMNFEKYHTEWNGDYDEWLQKGYPVEVYETLKARDILKQIAEAAWLTGDPGVLFKDTAQKYSTGYFDSKLLPKGVNPCLPDWAPVLTPKGYKKFKDVENKVYLNNKQYNCSDLVKTHESADVYKVKLESGLCLYCTNDHKIQKVENFTVKDTQLKDLKKDDYVKVDYSLVNQKIEINEYQTGYNNIYTENIDLLDKSFSFQLGFIQGFLEKTDSFISYNEDDNYIMKGVFKQHRYLLEQIQLILSSLSVYSELKDFNNEKEITFLNLYDLDTLLLVINVIDEKIKNKFEEVKLNCTESQKKRIQQLKYKQRIKNIELVGQFPVFDINVPKKNYFVSSGVVVHNCGYCSHC